MTDGHGISTGRGSGLAYSTGVPGLSPAALDRLGDESLAQAHDLIEQVNAAAELYQIAEQRVVLCREELAEAQAAEESATESWELAERAVETFSATLRKFLILHGLAVNAGGIMLADQLAPAPTTGNRDDYLPGGRLAPEIDAPTSPDSEV